MIKEKANAVIKEKNETEEEITHHEHWEANKASS